MNNAAANNARSAEAGDRSHPLIRDHEADAAQSRLHEQAVGPLSTKPSLSLAYAGDNAKTKTGSETKPSGIKTDDTSKSKPSESGGTMSLFRSAASLLGNLGKSETAKPDTTAKENNQSGHADKSKTEDKKENSDSNKTPKSKFPGFKKNGKDHSLPMSEKDQQHTEKEKLDIRKFGQPGEKFEVKEISDRIGLFPNPLKQHIDQAIIGDKGTFQLKLKSPATVALDDSTKVHLSDTISGRAQFLKDEKGLIKEISIERIDRNIHPKSETGIKVTGKDRTQGVIAQATNYLGIKGDKVNLTGVTLVKNPDQSGSIIATVDHPVWGPTEQPSFPMLSGQYMVTALATASLFSSAIDDKAKKTR